MTQHLLHASHIRPVLQHMHRKGMPERMRCNVSLDTGFVGIPLQNLPESLTAHRFSGAVGKQSLHAVSFYKRRTPFFQVTGQGIPADAADRDHTFFVVRMTGHKGQPQIDILYLQMDQLTHPHTRGIQKLQHGTVPQTFGCGYIRLTEKTLYFGYRQDLRCLLFYLGRTQRIGRI